MNIASTVLYFLAALALFKMPHQYVRYDEGEMIAPSAEMNDSGKEIEEQPNEKEEEEQKDGDEEEGQ